jgi:hypothetical protein
MSLLSDGYPIQPGWWLSSIASDPGDISNEEKERIAFYLRLTPSPDLLFEPTSYSANRNLIGREPDFRMQSGREFWLYREHEQLPIF